MSYDVLVKHDKPVTVYGVNHSPWVQGVCLALHLKSVAFKLVSRPYSWASYRQNGVVMPVCQWPDGSETRDSFVIMRELERRYPTGRQLGGLNDDSQLDLEHLFMTYALGRAGGRKSLAFIAAWSRMPSGESVGGASVFRSLMCLYFLLLISAGRVLAKRRGHPIDDGQVLAKALRPWDLRLQSTPFLHGDEPGLLDCALLGHVQCMCTGLTEHTFPVLQAQTGLVQWIKRLQPCLSSYPHNFSARIERPNRYPDEATFMDRVLFWISIMTAVVAMPLTFCLLVDAILRRRDNPARSGAALDAHSRFR